MYPRPLSGVPAGTLLLGALFDAPGLSLGRMPGILDGDGVKGVEKGWAAEVDVAGGGDPELERLIVVEKVR